MNNGKSVIHIAAIADVHCSRTSQGNYQTLFAKIQEKADVLLICGDITSYGLAQEAEVFAKELKSLNIPSIAVLGNHDYEGGQSDDIKSILASAGLRVLDGDTCEFHGIGFAGVKGFAGGFGDRELQPWGEKIIKQFVDESVSEALKLEAALARLQTKEKIVLLHYAPIEATIEGENKEIYPFLGSTRLEEALNRYKVSAVFHGHAHGGRPEGKTSAGIPVFNVALPVLQRLHQSATAFRIHSITLPKTEAGKPPYEQATRSH